MNAAASWVAALFAMIWKQGLHVRHASPPEPWTSGNWERIAVSNWFEFPKAIADTEDVILRAKIFKQLPFTSSNRKYQYSCVQQLQ